MIQTTKEESAVRNIKKVLYDDLYEVRLNGIAVAGWVTASLCGVVFIIKEIWTAF